MGLMFRRRRPVARLAAGAATADIAYHYGKKHVQQQAYDQQAQAAYEATQAQQYAPPPPPPAPAPIAAPSRATADLDHLVSLHSSGVLSDAEFSAAKATLLGL